MPARPLPTHLAPPGKTWVQVPDDPNRWRVQSGRACRYTVAKHTVCAQPTLAAMNRGKAVPGGPHGPRRMVASWWAYCAAHCHGFGRWVEAGQVWHWELADDDAADFFSPTIEVR